MSHIFCVTVILFLYYFLLVVQMGHCIGLSHLHDQKIKPSAIKAQLECFVSNICCNEIFQLFRVKKRRPFLHGVSFISSMLSLREPAVAYFLKKEAEIGFFCGAIICVTSLSFSIIFLFSNLK